MIVPHFPIPSTLALSTHPQGTWSMLAGEHGRGAKARTGRTQGKMRCTPSALASSGTLALCGSHCHPGCGRLKAPALRCFGPIGPEHLLCLSLRLNVQVWVQVQRLSRSDVHLFVKLRASHSTHLNVIAAGPKIQRFEFSDSACVSAVDVYLCVFNVGVKLHRASGRSVTVIAVSVRIRSSPIRGVPPPPVRRCNDYASRTCKRRKRCH